MCYTEDRDIEYNRRLYNQLVRQRVNMNLFDKFMKLIRKELKFYGMANLSNFDEFELLLFRLNLANKLINVQKYEITESPKIQSKLAGLDKKYSEAYDEIKGRLKNGEDVNPFLSKLAIKPRIQDNLLLDWRIHHFHLNKINSGTYFNDRSEQLIMTIFSSDIAHFIDIEHHNEPEVFIKQEYLQVIKDNWPDLLTQYTLRGILPPASNLNNQKIKDFRKAGLNSFIVIDGKTYAPIGGGLTTAKTGLVHTQKAIRVKATIKQLEKHYSENEKEIMAAIKSQLGIQIDRLDLDFAYNDRNQLVLVDKTSKAILQKVYV